MASSAVYRYFPSRDDLLTALIVDTYDAMGEAAEVADAQRPNADLIGRWQAACAAVRTWALANPHEYALVYGSPVPGYAAPEATIGPAGRVGVVLCRIVADGIASGVIDDTSDGSGLDTTIQRGLAAELGLPADPTGSVAARAVHAWTSLFGLINFELFGHTHNVVVNHEAFFTSSTERLAVELGVVDGSAP
jgi:AcrR family transcriptional regulator